MQVSIESTGSLERKLTVKIPAERVESRVRERFNELGRTVRIKGFRPGKVPAKVIEQRYGQQVRSEAMNEEIGRSFQEAVRQEKLRPAVAPAIQANPAASGGEIEYTATFEVVPEIGRIDVSTLEVTRIDAAVSEADIDRMIETLRLQRRSWNPVERAAGPGDMVMFEYNATAADARHPASGNDRAATLVGSGAFVKEVEDALAGMRAGEVKTVQAAFPAGFREPVLAGKSASVEVTAVRVQEQVLPAVDEAFIASFGIRDGGLAKFRADVRANLDRELRGAVRGRTKGEVIEKLVNAWQDVEVPPAMARNEARALLAQAQQQAKQRGVEPPSSTDPFMAAATRRVRAFLLLNELAQQNQVQVDSKRVAEELALIASTYEQPEQVVALYQRDQELMSGLRNRVLEDQVVEWIVEHAKVTPRSASFDELMKQNAGA
ncbi:trigger factor [Thauera sp.]|uniref:trigger factor n=1 Tax=Thauera sp. TaxID=1905334 RepID=UPI001B4FBDA4|nr:trigger factor [Thauera sp.]MBP6133374.1 trigger factor [Thauera sp.]MBP7417705.1 trigger factor [Xanthomonadales bacterium]